MNRSNTIRSQVELMRLNKPIGTCLLLWPALWALWVSTQGHPPLYLIIVFSLGALCTRTLGCVINDMVDAPFDRFVKRTQNRPLTSGRISHQQALILAGCLLILALVLAFQLKIQTIAWAFGGFVLMVVYPWIKRISHLPQLVLALAFSVAIPMVYSETLGHAWETETLSLLMANVLWVLAYDTQYACMDKADDLKLGLKSTAILLGELAPLFIHGFEAFMLIVLFVIGATHHWGWGYYVLLSLCIPCFYMQSILMRSTDPADQVAAFSHHNAIGALVFLAFYTAF